ncbi:MAG: GIY-YIG nuclease family protein [Gillisia sp.]
MRKSHVYITTTKRNTALYTGVTSNLVKRIHQHKTKFYKKSFSARYNCDKLVYFQEFADIRVAIAYEKKLKAGSRTKKENLINEMNPEWEDLADGWVFDF